MQDIKPPSERKAPASTDAEFSTEMVDNVPVQAPSSAAQSTGSVHGNPIAQDSVPGPLEASQEGEMDKILEEVNKKVKSAAADNSPKTSLKDFFKHSALVSGPEKPAHPKSRLLMVVIVAMAVGTMLIVAAYYALGRRTPATQPGQPLQSSGQAPASSSSVTTDDIDGLSKDIQSQIDTLNDSQNFDPAPLSDSALGL